MYDLYGEEPWLVTTLETLKMCQEHMKEQFQSRFSEILNAPSASPLCWSQWLDAAAVQEVYDEWTAVKKKEVTESIELDALKMAVEDKRGSESSSNQVAAAAARSSGIVTPPVRKRRGGFREMITPPKTTGEVKTSSDDDETANSDMFLLKTTISNEMNLYNLTMKQIASLDHDVDPFDWWRANRGTFPHLAKVARKWLSVPASSTPTERVFSIAGLMDSAKRSNLHPKKLGEQVFVHNNHDRMTHCHDQIQSLQLENYKARKRKRPSGSSSAAAIIDLAGENDGYSKYDNTQHLYVSVFPFSFIHFKSNVLTAKQST
jgi:hypothetical protein